MPISELLAWLLRTRPRFNAAGARQLLLDVSHIMETLQRELDKAAGREGGGAGEGA